MTTQNVPPSIELVAGDVNDERILIVPDFADLTWVSSVIGELITPSTGSITNLTASVADAAAKTVRVNFGAGGGWLPTAPPGEYRLRLQLTGGGQVLTVPSQRSQYVVVIVST